MSIRSSKLDADTRNASRSGGSSMYAVRTRASRIATALVYSASKPFEPARLRWRGAPSARSRRSCCADKLGLERDDRWPRRSDRGLGVLDLRRRRPRAGRSGRLPVRSPGRSLPGERRCGRRLPPSRPPDRPLRQAPTATSARTSPTRASGSPSHRSSFAHRQARPSSDSRAKRLERRSDVAAKRADLRAVVLVGDRSRAMVELELPQRGERTVALLEQLEPPSLVLVETRRARRTRARARAGTGSATTTTHATASAAPSTKRQGQRVAGRPTSEARATSRRCSRLSGHSVMSEPSRKTSPASQMRLTSGLTKTRK